VISIPTCQEQVKMSFVSVGMLKFFIHTGMQEIKPQERPSWISQSTQNNDI
jgi:hypothetical protein